MNGNLLRHKDSNQWVTKWNTVKHKVLKRHACSKTQGAKREIHYEHRIKLREKKQASFTKPENNDTVFMKNIFTTMMTWKLAAVNWS